MLKKFKTSIKWEFTLIYVGLIILLLMAVILANNFFLERVYTNEKINVLESAYDTMDRMITDADAEGGLSELFPDDYDPSDPAGTSSASTAFNYLSTLSEANNFSIVLLDTTTDRVYSFSQNEEQQEKRLAEYIFGNRKSTEGRIVRSFKNYQIEENRRLRSGSVYLESWGYFSDNSTCFLMSMPIAGLREAVDFFNNFLLLIGVVVILAGAVIVYFASREISKPINSLAVLSERMSDLDFSKRYEGNAENEIGILGKSMNKLSDTLEKTIAELKSANIELQSDVENKTKMAEKQKEFVANVSHELKTPIALIQGYAEGLTEGMADDLDSRNYYCSVIVDEAKRMNRMVRELMNLSALEQGKDLPDITLFNLNKVIRGVISASDILLKQKKVSLEVDVPDNINVWADEFKIEEVITNYLNNALNHLMEPNEISIYSEREPDGIISLHVMNTGNPIPEEDLSKIWEKFFKVDKAHTRSYGGSGLGLSIVKAIADAHHQKCGVRNTRNGVDFWFTLDSEEKGVSREEREES